MPIYFTDAARAVTDEQIRAALVAIADTHPFAHDNGLQHSFIASRRPGAKPVDILESASAFDAVRHCVDWLTHFSLVSTTTKGVNPRHSAYVYKHDVERWVRAVKGIECGLNVTAYIPMMALIAAAQITGIRYDAKHNPRMAINEHWYNRFLDTEKPAFVSSTSRKTGRELERLAGFIASRYATTPATAYALHTSPDFSGWRWMHYRDRDWLLRRINEINAQASNA